MNTRVIAAARELNEKSQNMTPPEYERKRPIEETRRRISVHTLKSKPVLYWATLAIMFAGFVAVVLP